MNTKIYSYTYEEAGQIAEKEGLKFIPTLCSMCGPVPGSCGIYAFTKNGKFVKAAGMKEAPVNNGSLCPKGHAAPQWVYSSDRLKIPLRRTGKKGEGKFEKISWDDAVSVIAEKLSLQKKESGPESLAILAPAFRSYNAYMSRFLTAHGSPNYAHSGICAMQRAFAFLYTVADWPQADIENSDLIIYWGRQPVFSSPAMAAPKMLTAAKSRGARIISIKPSVEPDAGMADLWLPVRPGTDAALALAMLNIVAKENLIDTNFVEEWCYGYDKLQEHVKQYPPEWAEKITGIPAKKIIETARLYATTGKACIDLGNGVEHAPSASDTIRSVAILMAITGHLDRPGTNLFGGVSYVPGSRPMPKDITLRERYSKELIDKLVAPEFPKVFQPFLEGISSSYYKIFESVLTGKPYPIRSVISPGTQPSVSNRGSKNVIKALEKLDFYVVIDVMRTADMNYADVVLPVATPYETDHPFEARDGWIFIRNKVIDRMGDYKSIYEFFLDLGVAMGYGNDFWDGDINKAMDDQLQPFNLTVDELRKHPNGIVYPSLPRTYEKYEMVFNRPSPRLAGGKLLPRGKVAIYNTTFEQAGYRPLPEWTEPPESISGNPDLTKKYPLILSDYHTSRNFTASWQRNVPALRKIQPHPVLHIHPDTAKERGINNTDWIIVESPHGNMKVKAELFPGIRPDTVMILHGWWQGCREKNIDDYPLLDGGANVNNMYSTDTEKACDPLITAMSSQTLVQVRKA
ncbi:MAG: molybdopterin-dependent oxidoreductase [Spirochaetes bacterium]|nr:molybdopterin-dependent oxidoreductase [Spirochaetota bacterium]